MKRKFSVSDLTGERSLDEQLCTDYTSENSTQFIPTTSAELNNLDENYEPEADRC